MHPLDRRQFVKSLAAVAVPAALGHGAPAGGHSRIRAGQIGTRHGHASGKLATLRKLSQHFEVIGVVEPDDARWASVRDAEPYRGGAMFELGCHLIDVLVTVLGKPTRVTPYARRTRSGEDDLADNQLAVFEYPRATATIRSALVEVEGMRRRQFVVCGTQGTVEIQPLEPPRLRLTLDRPRDSFRKGAQEVGLPRLEGRYDGDFLDLARILPGEKKPDYGPAHDLAVHEAILEASKG